MISQFAADLQYRDIPTRIVDLCDVQTKSVVAATFASEGDPASNRVAKGIRDQANINLKTGMTKSGDIDSSSLLYLALTRSIALDFDDYMCFAHAGHSSSLVPIVAAELFKKTYEERIVAQVIGNEVAGRLGGSCLIGPLNGQMWSFVHAASSALCFGKLMGLDKDKLSNALSLALWQAPRPITPGFMKPDSKLLTALEPSAVGIRAAYLAAAGVSGPLDIFDARDGFYCVFSFLPIKKMFESIGDGWALDTLSVKAYPGCAYIDTIVDALHQIGPVDIDSIKSVDIYANALTLGMDKMSEPYRPRGQIFGADPDSETTPVNINFSVGINVAIMLIAGALTPAELKPEFLRLNSASINRVLSLTKLHHDSSYTLKSIASFETIAPIGNVLRSIPPNKLLQVVRDIRKHLPSVVNLSQVVSLIAQVDKPKALHAFQKSKRTFFDNEALENFNMTFPARVVIQLKTGQKLESQVSVPKGGAGNTVSSPAEIANLKYKTWTKNPNVKTLSIKDIVPEFK